MRNKKRLLTIICSFILVFCIGISFVGCSYDDRGENYTKIEEENFTYYRKNKTGEYYLTDNNSGANNPRIWHINPYYKGHEIISFGSYFDQGWSGAKYEFPSLDNVEIVSLPYCMEVFQNAPNKSHAYEFEWPKQIFIVKNIEHFDWIDVVESHFPIQEEYIREYFLSPNAYGMNLEAIKYHYNKYCSGTQDNLQVDECPDGKTHIVCTTRGYVWRNFKICKANTSYFFNYEDCPNDGCFFINDFEYGKTIENTPYEPLRAGYYFGGWYREPECINAWDFEKDTLPQAQYNEDGQELYQETKLYAKWIKQ